MDKTKQNPTKRYTAHDNQLEKEASSDATDSMPRDQPTELEFSSKMRFAFKKHIGLLLSASEVEILAKFDLTSCDFAPQTRREYTDCFQSMVKRAKKIRGNGLDLELSTMDVEAYVTVFNHLLAYDSQCSAEERYKACLLSYDDYRFNGSHVLDHKRDLTKYYSVAHTRLRNQSWGPSLYKLTQSQIEDVAEQGFFCAVASVERLEHAESTKTGAKFNGVEAAGLARITKALTARHPGLKIFETSAGHPQTTACRKIDEAMHTGKEALLTSEEVGHFLKLCQHIPRPKPCPFPRMTVEKANGHVDFMSGEREAGITCRSDEKPEALIHGVLNRIQQFLSKLDARIVDLDVVPLDHQEISGAGYAINRLASKSKQSFLDSKKNAGHPQVTAIEKIVAALYCAEPLEAALTLNRDEFLALAELFNGPNRKIILVEEYCIPRLCGVPIWDALAELSEKSFAWCDRFISSWKGPYDDNNLDYPAMLMAPSTSEMQLIKQKLLQSQTESNTSSSSVELVEITRKEAEILLRADCSKEMAIRSLRRSFEITTSHESALGVVLSKCFDIRSLYEERLAKVSEAFVDKSFRIYGKALSSTSRSHPKDLASLTTKCDFMEAEIKLEYAREEMLQIINTKLMALATALSRHPDEPTGLSQRLAHITTALSWETFQADLKSLQDKTAEAFQKASNANNEMRTMENSKAQTLFLALADQFVQNSGPDALKRLVWDICGPLLGGIVVDCGDDPAIPSVRFEIGPHAFPREFAFRYLGDGYDFLISESPVSEKLAAQLVIPSKTESELKADNEDGKIAWRCVPVAELDLWKMERMEAFLAYSDILTDWQKSRTAGHKEPPKGETIEPRSNIHSDQNDFLVRYIETIHSTLTQFLKAAFHKLDQPKEKPKAESYGLPTLGIVLYGIEEMKKRNQELSKRLTCEERLDNTVDAIESMIKCLPNMEDQFAKINKQDIEARLSLVINGIKKALRSRDNAIKDELSLRKAVALKDRKLQEAEAAITKARDFRGEREDELKSENQKLEANLNNVKHELEKALRVPDKVREEFFGKIQKLCDKVRDLEKMVREGDAAREILRLDQEATTKDLESSRGKVERYKEARKRWENEYLKLKTERDQLRRERDQLKVEQDQLKVEQDQLKTEQDQLKNKRDQLKPDRLSPGQDLEAVLQSLLRAQEKETEQALAEAAKLEEDTRTMTSMRASGEETLRELLQHQQSQNTEIANLQARLADMEEIQHVTLNELDNERKKMTLMEKDEAMKELEKQLSQEREKSKRLEAILGPVLAAAAAVSSL